MDSHTQIVYVGILSYNTTEEDLYKLFGLRKCKISTKLVV